MVVGIGRFNSGENYNIIASSARLEGTVRAFDEQVREHVLASIERIAVSVAAAHQTTAEVRRQVFADVLSNDPGATHFAARVAQQIRVSSGSRPIPPRRPWATTSPSSCTMRRASTPASAVGERPVRAAAPLICLCDQRGSLPIAAELHASYALRWLAGGHQG
ncbi:amidohydrolase [Propionibacterium freudenreichii]|uniref:hypothetical protein n=1 Tax=Propionibacterium freudenreichii TaxID=1744 RepID=UPI00254A5835|nr:hypothetical protein [Propionibacterium freudenreichii]MDK9592003.1 amidohydrolase [Propionibacterium freudenreichii]